MADQDNHRWISLWMSDWNGGTFMLTPMAEWAYFRLSMDIWESGKPITEDRAKRLLQRAGEQWRELIDELVDEGKITLDRQGRHRIRRAEIEHKRAADRYAAKSGAAKKLHENGKKTAPKSTPKKQKKSDRSEIVHDGEHDATRTGTESRVSSNEDTTPHRPPLEQSDFLSPIPDEAWAEYENHRKGLGKKLSPQARTGARRKLERIHAEHGHDPAKVIEQSIENGWVGLFPLKDTDRKGGSWELLND